MTRRFPWRILLWLLAATSLAGIGFLYGFASREQKIPPYKTVMRLYERASYQPAVRAVLGPMLRFLRRRERVAAAPAPGTLEGATGPLTAAQRQQLARLEALGYVSGVRSAPGATGILRHDPARAYPGVNLVVSGHAAEAMLLDMEGQPLHRWSCEFGRAFPEQSRLDATGTRFWRRAHLYPTGDLLAVFDNRGLIKLDRDGGLLWTYPGRTHHDLDVGTDGLIYVLESKIRLIPRLFEERPVVEDFVTILDPEGGLRRQVSLLTALEDSPYAPVLADLPERGDIFHTNTLELIDASRAWRLPALAAGNVLVSMRELDLIAVVDLERERVVWAMTGMWRKQHQPTLVGGGNILVFDNQGNGGASRILEFDPSTQEVVWTYAGSAEAPLSSAKLGSNQRLPNGNTLIVESEAGRALEVTPDGTVVWEYVSPFRAGERGELIANLFDLVRLERASYAAWLPPTPPV